MKDSPYTAAEQTSPHDDCYRSYFDNAPYGIYVIDRECRIVDVNLAITKITGYTKDDLLKMHASDLTPSIEPNTYFDSAYSFVKTGIQCKEIGLLTKTSEFRWVAVEGAKLSEDRFICFMRDETESRPADLYSNERDQELKLIASESPTVFAYVDSGLRYRHVNNQYLEYFKLQKSDVIGKPVGAKSGLPKSHFVKSNLSMALSGKRSSCELSIPSSIDGPKCLNFTFIPDHDNKGSVRGVFLIAKDITKRKNLLTSERRLAQVMEATDNTLWEWNYTTGKGYFSARFYTMLGYAPGEFAATYESTKELIHPDDIDSVYATAKLVQKNKGSFSHEYRMKKKSGEWAWVLNRGKVVKLDMEGNALRAVGTLKDITERKLAQEALLESEARYRSYVDNAPHGVFLVDCEGRYLDANPAAEQITGFSRDELLQKTMFELLDEKASVIQQVIQETIDAGSLQVGVSFTRADGELRWCDIEAIKLNKNELLGFVTDITERKQAEDALRKSEENYRRIFENATEGIFQNSEPYRFSSVNAAYARMFGYDSIEEMMHIPDTSVLYVNTDDQKRLMQMLDESDKVEGFECEYYRKDGSTIWVSANIHAVRDSSGNFLYCEGTNVDITGRKQAEKALKESEERYRTLFTSMNEGFALHELVYDDTGNPIDYRYLEINEAFERHTGLKREDVTGKTQREVIPTEADYWLEVYANIAITGRATRFENYSTALQKWYEVYAFSPIRGQFAVLVTDITNRKHAEQELRENEERFRYIIKHNPDAIAVYDKKLNYMLVSDRYLKDYRLGDQDIIGRHHYDVFPEMPQRWKDVHQRCLQGAIESADEDSFVRLDGLVDYNRWECRPWHHSNGTIGGIITYTEVITKRKLAEDALRERSQELDAIFDSAPIAMLLVDHDIRVTKINHPAIRAAEGNADELLGCYCGDVFRCVNALTFNGVCGQGENCELCALRNSVIETFATGYSVRNREISLTTQSGSLTKHCHLLLSTALLQLRDGNEVLISLIDITDRKLMENALRDSNRQLRALSKQLLQVQESERRKIARDLHDEIGAMATALSISLSLSREVSGEIVKRNIEQAIEIAGDLTARVRDISLDLRPSMLDDLGLERALNWYFERYISRTRIQVEFRHRGLDKRFPAEMETAAYRIIQEAATNTARYANINKIYIVIYGGKHRLKFKIIDRGVGFDTKAVLRKAHTGGIIGISERASLLGGKVVLKSKPGQGTSISVSLPILNAETQ